MESLFDYGSNAFEFIFCGATATAGCCSLMLEIMDIPWLVIVLFKSNMGDVACNRSTRRSDDCGSACWVSEKFGKMAAPFAALRRYSLWRWIWLYSFDAFWWSR